MNEYSNKKIASFALRHLQLVKKVILEELSVDQKHETIVEAEQHLSISEVALTRLVFELKNTGE